MPRIRRRVGQWSTIEPYLCGRLDQVPYLMARTYVRSTRFAAATREPICRAGEHSSKRSDIGLTTPLRSGTTGFLPSVDPDGPDVLTPPVGTHMVCLMRVIPAFPSAIPSRRCATGRWSVRYETHGPESSSLALSRG